MRAPKNSANHNQPPIRIPEEFLVLTPGVETVSWNNSFIHWQHLRVACKWSCGVGRAHSCDATISFGCPCPPEDENAYRQSFRQGTREPTYCVSYLFCFRASLNFTKLFPRTSKYCFWFHCSIELFCRLGMVRSGLLRCSILSDLLAHQLIFPILWNN